jgi:uncharacterized SAM-binding protein YcdF (DUF218 family)
MSQQTHPRSASVNNFFTVLAIVIAVGLSTEIFWLGIGVFLRAMGAILVTADPLVQSDSALILSGGDDTRIGEAARLYQEGYIEYVILTETGVEIPEWGTNYSNLMRFSAIQLGIPGSAILVTEQHVDSTLDEARTVLKFARQRGFDTLIVITDPYHILRTRLIFQEVFESDDIQVTIHPVRNHWYRSNSWWLSLRGWKFTLQEVIKLFGYLAGIQ